MPTPSLRLSVARGPKRNHQSTSTCVVVSQPVSVHRSQHGDSVESLKIRRYSVTSLMTQRRGKQTVFQKIRVSRNQHPIHHRCPQLSTTSEPGQANNSKTPTTSVRLDSSQPASRFRHMNQMLQARGQVHPASPGMRGLKMPLQ